MSITIVTVIQCRDLRRQSHFVHCCSHTNFRYQSSRISRCSSVQLSGIGICLMNICLSHSYTLPNELQLQVLVVKKSSQAAIGPHPTSSHSSVVKEDREQVLCHCSRPLLDSELALWFLVVQLALVVVSPIEPASFGKATIADPLQ